ncbi:nucleobase-ascorbate transporter-like [Raphidocelis subcapitata]|uniref:Nucleobase-ascorbate transporter-like n=1 Tax=Raphidocelis subcapitata TaxID=307507 RepID=A0A2V0P9Q2_9CHLO|nr:nucleobase-ascorbate transporter-like [Raphidocelis subcapitata]|eukprot:GBF96299.1 nucleobase-ascorbate transporter-like [Raphidocelis subcapitata]
MKYTAAAGGAAGPAGVPEPLPLGAGTGDHVGGAPRAPSGGVVPKDVADTQHGLRYEVLDRPPLPQAILLGFQQYLVMLGSTVLIPSLVVPPMGATKEELARVICTIFFASGLVTLLQTFLGDRLPIVQGGSFAYISPALAVTAHVKATMQFASEHERFHYSMRVVSGGIIGSGLIVFGIGALGIIRPVLRAISPITVAVNIAVLSLSLTAAGFPGVMGCPHLGFTTIALVVLFSQYLRRFAIPLGRGRRWHVFELCPGLSVSQYFGEYPKTHGGQGPIATGSAVADNVLNSIFSTAAAVSLIITVILDNTIPGTDAERGLTSWLQPHLAANGAAGASGAGAGGGGGGAGGAAAAGDGWWWEDERMNAVYGLPFDLTRRWEAAAGARLRAWRARALAGARRALACGGRCRGRGGGGGGGGGGSGGSPAAAEVGAGGSAVALTVRAAGGADGSGAAVGGDFAAVAGSAAARRGAGERV